MTRSRTPEDAPHGGRPPVSTPVAASLPPVTEPITALTARRMGPVRRFFHRRPVVMDVVVACWYLLPAVATLLWQPGVAGRATALVLATLAGAALLRRRHEPVLVLGVIIATLSVALLVLGDTVGIEIASVLALYAVAAYRRATTAWVSLAVLNIVYAATYSAWATSFNQTIIATSETSTEVVELTATQALVVTTSTQLALSVIALALGAAARGRRLHVAMLVDRTTQLALERDQREQIALVAERNRIAREMHDVVAHSLSVMVALSDGAAAALERRPEQARQALAELSATGRSALADTRRVLGVLREDAGRTVAGPEDDDAPLAPQPTATPTLGDLIARFQAAGLPVTFEESGPPLPADTGLRLAVFRIVQESLTNVLRHAPESPRIAVTLERWPDRVVIEVDNDDGATVATRPGGRGVVGMRERAAVYDGHVDAGPTAGGWRVRAVLRWTEEDTR